MMVLGWPGSLDFLVLEISKLNCLKSSQSLFTRKISPAFPSPSNIAPFFSKFITPPIVRILGISQITVLKFGFLMEKMNSSAIGYLTEDLLMEILARIPTKTLSRCRCVCKLWLKLITHPRFIEFYSNQSNLRNPSLMLTTYPLLTFRSVDSELVDESENLKLDLPQSIALDSEVFVEPSGLNLDPLMKFTAINVIGSCNGLFCLSDYVKFMSLWNPSTGEHVKVPFYSVYRKYAELGMRFVLGFGYDVMIEDYKVVRVTFSGYVFGGGFWILEVMVYTLGTNSWRKVENAALPACYVHENITAVHVNGALHWVGNHPIGGQVSQSIVSFNLKNGTFGEVSWPDLDGGHRNLILGVWEGCLAIFRNPASDGLTECFEMWMLKEYGVKESWIRVLSIKRSLIPSGFNVLQPLLLQKNGDILLHKDTGLLLYNPVNETAKVPIIGGSPNWFRTIPYVINLTSIASLMVEDGAESSENKANLKMMD